jgi:hypothetical protein
VRDLIRKQYIMDGNKDGAGSAGGEYG